MSYNIAVVGATGAVGREMLQTLFERKFPIKNIFALASRSSVGKEVSFGDDKILKVSSVDDFNFEKADIALSAFSKLKSSTELTFSILSSPKDTSLPTEDLEARA